MSEYLGKGGYCSIKPISEKGQDKFEKYITGPFSETGIGSVIASVMRIYRQEKGDYDKAMRKMENGGCKPYIVEMKETKLQELETILETLLAIPQEAAIMADAMKLVGKSFGRIICLYTDYGQEASTESQTSGNVSFMVEKNSPSPWGMVIDFNVK